MLHKLNVTSCDSYKNIIKMLLQARRNAFDSAGNKSFSKTEIEISLSPFSNYLNPLLPVILPFHFKKKCTVSKNSYDVLSLIDVMIYHIRLWDYQTAFEKPVLFLFLQYPRPLMS